MSSETQRRKPAGTHTGGQFATTARAETGLTLTPDAVDTVPTALGLGARLDERREHLEWVRSTATILRDQLASAAEARGSARCAREAREAGGDLAELEFMLDDIHFEEELTHDEIALLEARVEVERDPHAAIRECMSLRDPRTATSDRLQRASSLLMALDLEVDKGPGHIGYHPWRNEQRTDLLAELKGMAAACPHLQEGQDAAEQLAVLRDPLRPRRLWLQARRTNREHSPEALHYEQAVTASARNHSALRQADAA